MNNKSAIITSSLHIIKGDITSQDTDAIVNAANPTLLGGGGVDGAIHRAAGTDLLLECKKIGGCNHGEARITGAYNLPAQYIIHTPGPIYKNGKNNEALILKNSYRNSLKLAYEHNLKSISFPAISAGIYAYPLKEACKIAVDTVIDFLQEISYTIDVYFVLFDEKNFNIYNDYINILKNEEL